MKSLLFVLNPCAGQRKANRVLAEIIGIFNRAAYQVITHVTASQGQATQVVQQYADSVDLVICCGGDGTLNETVAGLLACGRDIPIGYIPAGSTNDLASSLKLSSDILTAARDAIEGTPERFDVGSFQGRYFSYVASFGAFTKISYTTPQNVKNAMGHAAYVFSGIQELTQIKPKHLRFELDDGQVIEDDFLFGAISNSTSIGGILSFPPDTVDLQDGQFELLLIRPPKDAGEMTEFLSAVQKQTYRCAMVTLCKARTLHITAPADMDWTLDGEREPGKASITVENHSRAVQIIRREEKK